MSEDYLRDDEKRALKSKLYSYLADKAQRRGEITSGPAYEAMQKEFGKQRMVADAGAYLDQLSTTASMAGTLGGKRSEVSPQGFGDKLAGSMQNQFNNMERLRNMEERAIGTDLNIAGRVLDMERYDDTYNLQKKLQESNLQTAELNREKLRKELEGKAGITRRFTDRILGPDGRPVVLDEAGEPTQLPPGFTLAPRPVSARAAQPRQPTILQDYQGPDGGPVERDPVTGKIRPVELPPGITPKATAAKKKTEAEAGYRYKVLQGNLSKLRDLVEKYGTVEMTGPAGTEMDSIIYQVAVDFAKLVDPDSVAREGEVAAAQKYMLPIRTGIGPAKGIFTRNSTAIALIDNYMKDLDRRLEARGIDPKAFKEKKVIRVQRSKSGDKTKITYDDGSTRVIDGRQ